MSPSKEQLEARVRELMMANLSEGYAPHLGQKYSFIKPSPSTYPFQWFWDTCFHVFILCALGEHERAKRNLLSLFAPQRPDGFVGHIIFWINHPLKRNLTLQARLAFEKKWPQMTALIQPPFIAQAARRIWLDTRDKAFLQELWPQLKAYHQWVVTNRDFDGDGLISIISPFESGMDWKPTFDRVVNFGGERANRWLWLKIMWVDLRNFWRRYNLPSIKRAGYFRVKEVGFNTVYVQDLYAMAALAAILGEMKTAAGYRELAQRVTRNMIKLMWDGMTKAFYDVYGPNDKKSWVITPTVFFPAVLPDIPTDLAHQMVTEHLENKQEFNVPYPLNSVAVAEYAFDPDDSLYLWRGPTWIYSNWFLNKYLRDKGFVQIADYILDTTKELISLSGFREFYHPLTGHGGGAHDFTWSGLVLDMMREETVEDKPS